MTDEEVEGGTETVFTGEVEEVDIVGLDEYVEGGIEGH